jgi:hypothetical protein
MRSRDGNHSFTLRFCTIIFFFSLALNAGEYLISYKYVVKNAILYNESLAIAKSMQPCRGTPLETLILPKENGQNLQALISHNSETFLEYIHTLGLDIHSTTFSTNTHLNATTVITLKTQCFKVDFNDTFVKISHLKQQEN